MWRNHALFLNVFAMKFNLITLCDDFYEWLHLEFSELGDQFMKFYPCTQFEKSQN